MQPGVHRHGVNPLATGTLGLVPISEQPDSRTRSAAGLDPAILEILRCPATGSPLRQEADELVALDDATYRYPIQHGVPKLLADHTP